MKKIWDIIDIIVSVMCYTQLLQITLRKPLTLTNEISAYIFYFFINETNFLPTQHNKSITITMAIEKGNAIILIIWSSINTNRFKKNSRLCI